MGQPIFYEVVQQPGTTCAVLLCCAVWLYIQHKRWGYAEVGFSYDTVVKRHQYWRLIVAQLSHVEILHLLFNVTAVWSMGYAEQPALGGTAGFFKVSLLLLLLSGVICIGVYHALVQYLRMEVYQHVTAVGFSCVAFGWMTWLALTQGRNAKFSMLGMAHLPMALAPFLSLLLTSVIVPNASFIGHLSGIVAGFVCWLGVASWMTPYWMVCLLVLVAIGLLYGLVQEGVIGAPYIRFSRHEHDLETGSVPLQVAAVPSIT